MGKAAIYHMFSDSGKEEKAQAKDKAEALSDGGLPGPTPDEEQGAAAPASDSASDSARWAFVDKGDRAAIPAAKALLRQYGGWTPLAMTRDVLSELRGRDVPVFVIRPYYDQWAAWGTPPDMLALALARTAQKERVRDPLKLMHYIVRHYAIKTGLAQR